MLKSVEPNEVVEAVSGLYGVLLAVIATLRFKFAAAVTLGSSIGDMFLHVAERLAQPALVKALPLEYHKWIDPCIRLCCQGMGVSLAWLLQRVMSALHCSMRGAFIVVTQVCARALTSHPCQHAHISPQTLNPIPQTPNPNHPCQHANISSQTRRH